MEAIRSLWVAGSYRSTPESLSPQPRPAACADAWQARAKNPGEPGEPNRGAPDRSSPRRLRAHAKERQHQGDGHECGEAGVDGRGGRRWARRYCRGGDGGSHLALGGRPLGIHRALRTGSGAKAKASRQGSGIGGLGARPRHVTTGGGLCRGQRGARQLFRSTDWSWTGMARSGRSVWILRGAPGGAVRPLSAGELIDTARQEVPHLREGTGSRSASRAETRY